MSGELSPQTPEEPTLVHGQEPIIVSQAGDPGYEAQAAIAEGNLAEQQAASDLMRQASEARQAVAQAQLERPLAPNAITEMPKTPATPETPVASEPDLKKLEEIKADGLKRRHQRYIRKPWQIITDLLPRR